MNLPLARVLQRPTSTTTTPAAVTYGLSGEENYFLSADGLLMPAKKDQAPPDLRYFEQMPIDCAPDGPKVARCATAQVFNSSSVQW